MNLITEESVQRWLTLLLKNINESTTISSPSNPPLVSTNSLNSTPLNNSSIPPPPALSKPQATNLPPPALSTNPASGLKPGAWNI